MKDSISPKENQKKTNASIQLKEEAKNGISVSPPKNGLSIPPPIQQKSNAEPASLKPPENSFLKANTSNAGLAETVQAKMENSFGQDFSNVNIHKDSAQATNAGALAYAQGNDVHFAPGQYNPQSQKGQELIGHELTHVVQQREGRVKPTKMLGKGMAVNDDTSLEKEADVMGAKAAKGENIQQFKHAKNVSTVPVVQNKVIQRYTDVEVVNQKKDEWKLGSDARVADNGQTVTSNTSSHECFADKGLITKANSILASKKSGIEITAGGSTLKGSAPDGSGKKILHEVVPTIKTSTSVSGTQDFWTDCGRSSREVMGPSTKDQSPQGIYKNKGKLETTKKSTNPANFRDEILIKAGLGKDAASARAAYLALSTSEKDKFDKKHQINKYANPEIGEAFVSRRDDASTSKGFNFHWGGVIMDPGHDKVTFENFAKTGTKYNTKDKKWYFETYGPPSKKGQTFHEKNEGSVGAKGKNNTTMAATTAGLIGVTNHAGVHLVSDPSNYKTTLIGKMTDGTKIKIVKRGNNWDKVKVLDGAFKGKEGWMMKKYFSY